MYIYFCYLGKSPANQKINISTLPSNFIVKTKSKQNLVVSSTKNNKTTIKNPFSSNNSMQANYATNTNHTTTPSNKFLLSLNKNNSLIHK